MSCGLDRRLRGWRPIRAVNAVFQARDGKRCWIMVGTEESVIQNNLRRTVAAGTKQKGAEMTRVIGAGLATVTGLRIRAGQLWMGTGSRALSF